VIFEPLDFIARLAALVPKPRVNLTRFHGVFAPNSKHRALVTPAKRGKGSKLKVPDEAQDQTPAERRAAMTWAQRLKRVFNIDIETCRECGGAMKVIADTSYMVSPRIATIDFLCWSFRVAVVYPACFWDFMDRPWP
jgi:hypothetical protein